MNEDGRIFRTSRIQECKVKGWAKQSEGRILQKNVVT
jgi:hypothetical protein